MEETKDTTETTAQEVPIEQIENPTEESTDAEKETEEWEKIGSEYVTNLLQLQVQLKQFHWNTTYGYEHVVFDKAYKTIVKHTDDFAEMIGEVTVGPITVEPYSSKEGCIEVFYKFKEKTYKVREQLDFPEATNIIDDILTEMCKLINLTLKQ